MKSRQLALCALLLAFASGGAGAYPTKPVRINPEAGVVSSEDRDVKDGKRIIRGTMFHTDESFIAEPPKATVLYAVQISL